MEYFAIVLRVYVVLILLHVIDSRVFVYDRVSRKSIVLTIYLIKFSCNRYNEIKRASRYYMFSFLNTKLVEFRI